MERDAAHSAQGTYTLPIQQIACITIRMQHSAPQQCPLLGAAGGGDYVLHAPSVEQTDRCKPDASSGSM